MKRPLFAVWAVLVLALVPFVALSGTASAVAASAVGYWNKAATPGPLAPVLAPPNVPDGGIFVAKDPSGPAAVATIRYPITEPGGGQLVLQVAEASTIQTATLNICPVAGPWEATENGAFDAQPANGCAELMINGAVSDDATSVSFFIPETFPLSNGNLEVFIVAADSSMPFTVAFEAPDDASFTPSSSGPVSDFPDFDAGEFGGESGGGDGGFSSGDSGFESDGSTGGASGGSFGGGGSGGDFSAPSSPSSGGSFTAPSSGGGDSFAAPGLEPTTEGSTGTAPGVPGSTAGTSAGTPQLTADQGLGADDGTARAIAIGTLLAIGAGLFFLSTRGGDVVTLAAAAGRAAPVAAATTAPRRGVGRFARPRNAAPIRL